MIRLLHASDLHLGKRFGHLPEEVRGRLTEARHGAIERLAAAARAWGADTILIAGDLFHTETPAAALRRQALAAMGAEAGLTFVILPGNHDSLLAEELWTTMRREAPPNVVLALEPRPVHLPSGLAVLPAPCSVRRPGRDLTDWMDAAATPEGTPRLGLAHGPIRDFSEDGGGQGVIAPDRARRAGLDYLALGDWHGRIAVDARSWYSGTPEPDSFKHEAPGSALLVTLEGAGAPATVEPVATAAFQWRTVALELLADEDAEAALAANLPPPGPARRQTLLRLVVSGRARLSARAALEAAIAAAAPDFAALTSTVEGLVGLCEEDDLDRIDRSGALRQAAEALVADGDDATRSESERAAAREALARLFAYAGAAAP